QDLTQFFTGHVAPRALLSFPTRRSSDLQLHETWAKVDRPGVYFGQCSELCGARHGFMPIAIEVVPPAQFAAWVASKGGHMAGAAPPAPNSTDSQQTPSAPPPGTRPAVQQPATAQD